MYKFNTPLFVELHALLGFDTITAFLEDWGKSRRSYDTILRGGAKMRVLLDLANRYHFDPAVFFYDDEMFLPASVLMARAKGEGEWAFAFGLKSAFVTPRNECVKWYKALLVQPSWRNKVVGALNPDPFKCTMTANDVLYVCNEYGVSPRIFFYKVLS